jgi:hypothetical protein
MLKVLQRQRARNSLLIVGAIAAFIAGWTLGSQPLRLSSVVQATVDIAKSHLMPSWEDVIDEPLATRAKPGKKNTPPTSVVAVESTAEPVMRLDQDESVVVEGRLSHDALKKTSQRGIPDEAEPHPWKKRSQNHWRIFIMFQHNLDILKQAVRSYRDASDIMTPNMIIIDNSVDQEASRDHFITSTVKEVVITPSRLNFPQLHNHMARLALERKLDFYFWAHADNYVLPLTETSDLGRDVLECLAEQSSNRNDWAGVFYSYDHLAAFNTKALIQVPWDPNVFQYGELLLLPIVRLATTVFAYSLLFFSLWCA